ncbi:MAG: CHAT domain-containing protein [Pyrinomonadaceae bacterium]
MADTSLAELRAILLNADAAVGSELLLQIAPVIPESLVDRAIGVADKIKNKTLRYRALTALAHKRPPEERDYMLLKLESLKAEAAGPEDQESGEVLASAPQISHLLDNISEEDCLFLLDEFLASLGDKLGTGKRGNGKRAKPPIAPADEPKLIPVKEPREAGSETKTSETRRPRSTRGLGGEKGTRPRSSGLPGKDQRHRGWTGGAQPAAEREVVPESQRIVSTGFAREETPAAPIMPTEPLTTGHDYFFWLEVGEVVQGSIEEEKIALQTELLPEGACLKVALFNFDQGLKLTPGADVGELEVQPNGSARVSKQPVEASRLTNLRDSELKERRLFFPVRAASASGTYRLRCSIYYKQFLCQSRLITVRVMKRPRAVKKALSAKVDYSLSRSLSPAYLTRMKPHLLSILLNSNGDGSHGFSFKGAGDFEKDSVSISGQKLQDLITQARDAYALAAWGAKNPWNQQNYRYDQSPEQNRAQLKGDLLRFARRGYNIYDSLISEFAGGQKKAQELAELMRQPGLLQIALKESPSFILPAALMYDYALDVDLPDAACTICQSFTKSLNDAATPLEQTDCFNGNCPTRDTDNVICPSGFWGYRQNIGFPLSIEDENEDGSTHQREAVTEITWQTKPVLTVGVSTDPQFKRRQKHLDVIRGLRADIEWNYGETREDVLRELKETKPHLVYFYCHGGVSETRPYLEVGSGDKTGIISPSNLRAKKILWDTPRPLVFINGCHTTALEPEKAIEFITAFVASADAAGVIGTEITIFEPLATAFAEDCLRRFLGGTPIGEAVRTTRLKLLKDGNPLGLVYIPYVMANLRLVQQNN